MLTGENGLLTKAQISSEQTKQKGAEEKVKLSVAESFDNIGHFNYDDFKNNVSKVEGYEKIDGENVIVDGVTIKVDCVTGKTEIVTSGGSSTGSLPSTDNTKPYLPDSNFIQVSGTTLDNGLTIKDSEENSYVWVEVPKTIYKTATSNTDYANIELDMLTYAANYGADDYADTWYDGCGIATEIEYNNLKQKMLKSVYDNGGFWISQYEIGTETLRTAKTDELTTPVSKEGAYVYNYVTVSQAQQLASGMNSGSSNSSLIYGIQWDLTLKYIEAKGDKTLEQIKTDSKDWGNCRNITFDITKGKYSTDNGKTYIEVSGSYTKPSSTSVLLTTGATDRNSSLHIYDMAGNVFEWTLQKGYKIDAPVTYVGGIYSANGNAGPASNRGLNGVIGSDYYTGFRVVLY